MGLARGPRAAWLLAALAALGVVLALHDSFLGMLFQWRSSSTFSYGVLILPIALFLAWRERAALARVAPESGWVALALMLPMGLVWSLAAVLDVDVVHQFAAVALVILAVWAVVGTPAARVIWFPLAYLFLMVPFGEFLVPTLMRWTADFAVLGVTLSGVPAYQDGFVFSLPSGDFEVIKACSGIRFLMATVAAGTVFAWVAYRSWRKRLLFLLACLTVPVVANLLRAYLVVMIVHLSAGRLAGAHVTYGLIFFFAILLGMFLVGARYADPPRPPDSDELVTASGRWQPLWQRVPASILAVLVAVGAGAIPGALLARARASALAATPAVPTELAGYVGTPVVESDWRPALRDAVDNTQAGFQSRADGTPIEVFVATFDPARSGDLSDARNAPFDRRAWRRVAGQRRPDYAEVILRPTPAAGVARGSTRVVWYWYRVNGDTTSERLAAKFLELRSILAGTPAESGLVAVSTIVDDDEAHARSALQEFSTVLCRRIVWPCPAGLVNP